MLLQYATHIPTAVRAARTNVQNLTKIPEARLREVYRCDKDHNLGTGQTCIAYHGTEDFHGIMSQISKSENGSTLRVHESEKAINNGGGGLYVNLQGKNSAVYYALNNYLIEIEACPYTLQREEQFGHPFVKSGNSVHIRAIYEVDPDTLQAYREHSNNTGPIQQAYAFIDGFKNSFNSQDSGPFQKIEE